MLELETMMEIKILRKQGKSLRTIARESEVSLNTVRKYHKRQEPPAYKMKAHKGTKLAPFQAYLCERVAMAYPVWIPAVVLMREICLQGYTGGMTQLRLYLKTLKPRTKPDPIVRFETAPGEQMQVDWIEFQRKPAFLGAFVATLGYSRASYVEFVTDQRVETLISCHERAFDYFGGVPFKCLYDNMKTVIDTRDAYGPGSHRLNKTFLDFAHHSGFQIKVCRPYRAQTKGKVERFNRYLRYSFYYPMMALLKQNEQAFDQATANGDLRTWLNTVANQRLHATTHQKPWDRLSEERIFLQPLPLSYQGHLKAAPPSPLTPYSLEPLQHPLSVYENLGGPER